MRPPEVERRNLLTLTTAQNISKHLSKYLALTMGSHKPRYHIICFLVWLLFSSNAHGNCYWPNGTDRNALLLQGDVYQPCNGGDKFSMCCATNRTPADRCRSDGLCQSTYDNNVWRDSCTDPYWKSPSCVKLCDHGIGE